MKIFSFKLFILIFIISCSNSEIDKNRLERIGYDLINIDSIIDWTSNNNNPTQDIVNISPKLYDKLKFIQDYNDEILIKVRTGDVDYPYGDGTADYVISLISNDSIDIRLKYDKKIDKFHVLGFYLK